MEDSLIFEGVAGASGLLNAEGVNGQKLASWNTVVKAADDILQGMITLDEARYHGPSTLPLAPPATTCSSAATSRASEPSLSTSGPS